MALHAFAEAEGPARRLADRLGLPFGLVETHAFPDGEVLPTVPGGADTVIAYRSLNRPNDKLVELVLAAEAWGRAGARRLVLVAPYLAYMRQDMAFQPGQAVSQTAIARLIAERFDAVVTVDPHLHRTATLAELFPGRTAHACTAAPAMAEWLKATHQVSDGSLVVGPDIESTALARGVAAPLGLEWMAFRKARRGDFEVELELEAPERVRGRRVVLVDDICSSGGTLIAASAHLRELGAQDVAVVVVHALFDEDVTARLQAAGADPIVSTDSLVHSTNAIALADTLAEALRREIDT